MSTYIYLRSSSLRIEQDSCTHFSLSFWYPMLSQHLTYPHGASPTLILSPFNIPIFPLSVGVETKSSLNAGRKGVEVKVVCCVDTRYPRKCGPVSLTGSTRHCDQTCRTSAWGESGGVEGRGQRYHGGVGSAVTVCHHPCLSYPSHRAPYVRTRRLPQMTKPEACCDKYCSCHR